MPRLPAIERLAALATTATEVFGRLGYRGTRTADVAAKAGMSTGSLFTYVESKEALFHLVFLHAFANEPESESPPALPLPTPGPGETIGVIERGLEQISMPRIRVALAEDDPPDAAEELRGVVEERYTLIEKYRPILAVIERCSVEMPELEAVWFANFRRGTFADLGTYLDRRMRSGLLRQMPDSTVAARVVTESLSWFAWHRHDGRDSSVYDDEDVRITVVEFICAALVPASNESQLVPPPRGTAPTGTGNKHPSSTRT